MDTCFSPIYNTIEKNEIRVLYAGNTLTQLGQLLAFVSVNRGKLTIVTQGHFESQRLCEYEDCYEHKTFDEVAKLNASYDLIILEDDYRVSHLETIAQAKQVLEQCQRQESVVVLWNLAPSQPVIDEKLKDLVGSTKAVEVMWFLQNHLLVCAKPNHPLFNAFQNQELDLLETIGYDAYYEKMQEFARMEEAKKQGEASSKKQINKLKSETKKLKTELAKATGSELKTLAKKVYHKIKPIENKKNQVTAVSDMDEKKVVENVDSLRISERRVQPGFDWKKHQDFDYLIDVLEDEEGLDRANEELIYQAYYRYSGFLRDIPYPLTELTKIPVERMRLHRTLLLEAAEDRNQSKKVYCIILATSSKKERLRLVQMANAQSYENVSLIVCDETSGTYENAITVTSLQDAMVYLQQQMSDCYVAFLNESVVWDVDNLKILVHQLEKHEAFSAVYGAQKHVKDNEQDVVAVHFAVYLLAMQENRCEIPLSTMLCRLDVLQQLEYASVVMGDGFAQELILRLGSVMPLKGIDAILSSMKRSVWMKESACHVITDSVCGSHLHLKGIKEIDTHNHWLYGTSQYIKEDCEWGKDKKPAIIIPSFETLTHLQLAVEAILAYTPRTVFDYELILVDNASSPIVKEYLTWLDRTYSFVTVILNEHNMGFTYAVNQGIKVARQGSDYILFNNDAIVTPGWLTGLYRAKADVPNAGIIAPRQQLVPRRRTIRKHVPGCEVSREVDVNLSFWHHGIKDVDRLAAKNYVFMRFVPFYLVMIPADAYAKVGLLDEENGRHYESDTLYCKVILEAGMDIVYTPLSKAYHMLQQATKELKEQDLDMYEIIFRKNSWEDMK